MKSYRGELEHIVYNKTFNIQINDQDFIKKLLNINDNDDEEEETYILDVTLLELLYQLEFYNLEILSVQLNSSNINIDELQIRTLLNYIKVVYKDLIYSVISELSTRIEYQLYSIYKGYFNY